MDKNEGGTRTRWWKRRWLKVVGGVVLAGVLGLGVAAEYVVRHAGPIVRERVVETLSAKFDAPVKLDRLDISLVRGIEVSGGGLRIPYGEGELIRVEHFSFRTTVKGLLHEPTHIAYVRVDGMELHVPPGSARKAMLGADPEHPHAKPKIAFTLGEIECSRVKLVIDTDKPGKAPLEFDISRLDLHDVGPSEPMLYVAELTNPKPVGQIHAEGRFGPWNADVPRETALDGTYRFDHADLSTIHGIGGMLSSTGKFEGELQRIAVDGTTDTPDFWIDVSRHPVPLRTVFHAYVNGTDGDTTLDPVQAKLLHSDITARGTVTRVQGQGHDIALDVTLPHARMEDMLLLGVKTRPVLMNGALTMHTKLHIPPGKERVVQKLELAGSFDVSHVEFNNAKWQDKIDGLSMRAQGRPQEAKTAASDGKAEEQSEMKAGFTLSHGLIAVNGLNYEVPGVHVLMNGVYSTNGDVFEFKGRVRTDATASQMVTGWKSMLLKPVDRFLKKDGAGMELPVSISGTGSDVNFGLARHGSADETTQQMSQDVKAKAAAKKQR